MFKKLVIYLYLKFFIVNVLIYEEIDIYVC